jgi:hypothetical protein
MTEEEIKDSIDLYSFCDNYITNRYLIITKENKISLSSLS